MRRDADVGPSCARAGGAGQSAFGRMRRDRLPAERVIVPRGATAFAHLADIDRVVRG